METDNLNLQKNFTYKWRKTNRRHSTHGYYYQQNKIIRGN